MEQFDVNNLLNNLFKEPRQSPEPSLKEIFEERVRNLNIPPTHILTILKIQYRTLHGILSGMQKTVDYTTLIKLADFLQLPREKVILLYARALEKNLSNIEVPSASRTVEFIKENFDLVSLKKAGFIKSINNYDQVEKSIKEFFGLKSIFEYKKPEVDVAFSAGLVKPKNELIRSMWIKAAMDTFKELNNPYEYNRQELIDYFPEIRWHSKSVEHGLTDIIKKLFKMGITVIYQAPLSSLHLRGATFSVNNKPCIVITDYKGFYPTLWFAMIHELYHVLFDWDEIRKNIYHLSDNEGDLAVIEKEKEANDFAREYLFSIEKLNKVKAYINDTDYIEEFAETNHVHHSFVYVFHAWDEHEPQLWAKAVKKNPAIDTLKLALENSWKNPLPISEFVNSIRFKYYI